MTRETVARRLLHAQLELHNTDSEALRSSLQWLDEARTALRALVAAQNLSESESALERALKRGVDAASRRG